MATIHTDVNARASVSTCADGSMSIILRRNFQKHPNAVAGTMTMARHYRTAFSVRHAVFISNVNHPLGTGIVLVALWCTSNDIPRE